SEPFLHPGKAARTNGGWLGELHPTLLEGTWGAFELDLEALVAESPATFRHEDVSPYPAVRQDLAFVVDEAVPAATLVAAIREAGGAAVRRSARESARSRSASRSAPRSARSPTRRRERCAPASSTRSRRATAPCSAPEIRFLRGRVGSGRGGQTAARGARRRRCPRQRSVRLVCAG